MTCRHTSAPTGYVAWHEWAEKKAKTHDQQRCPNCGLWAVWKRRAVGVAALHIDLTLRCPTCGGRADMCFAHGDEWKKRYRSNPRPVHRMTDHELRAAVNEFTQDDPPPYDDCEAVVSKKGS